MHRVSNSPGGDIVLALQPGIIAQCQRGCNLVALRSIFLGKEMGSDIHVPTSRKSTDWDQGGVSFFLVGKMRWYHGPAHNDMLQRQVLERGAASVVLADSGPLRTRETLAWEVSH